MYTPFLTPYLDVPMGVFNSFLYHFLFLRVELITASTNFIRVCVCITYLNISRT